MRFYLLYNLTILYFYVGKLITVFSAPNYCDQMGNKGAIVTFGPDMVPGFVQFSAVPHPPVKPMAYAYNYGMFGL